MNYAIINAGNTLVYSVHVFDGGDWFSFKTTWQAANPGYLLVDLGSSVFPAGQGWISESDGLYPPNLEYQGVNDVRPNILNAIQYRTKEIQYAGTVTFKDEQFPRDHTTRDDVVLLANSVSSSASMAAALLPLKVNAIDFSEVTISTVADAEEFALAMLSPIKSIYDGQATQIATVQGMSTITELITYTDPR